MSELQGQTSIGHRIFKASLVIFLAHIIFRLSSLVQYKIAGHYCDPLTRDIFMFTFKSVLITFYLIGEESLGPAFLPVLMEEKDKRDARSAWRFAGTVLSVQSILLFLVVVLVMLFPESVVRLFTNWESTSAPEEYLKQAPGFVRWMIPGLFALSIGSTTYLLLNSYKRFFLAAFGDASVKFAIIIAIILGGFNGNDWMFWLCLGVVAGSLAKVVTHLLGLRREVLMLRPNLAVNSPQFRHLLLLMAPLIVGILFAKVRDVFNDAWVMSYTAEEGLLSAHSFGKAIFSTVGWLVPYSASIAMFPFFCELVDRDNRKELARLVTTGSHIIWVLVVPIAALTVALSFPITRLLFQGGQFNIVACEQAATANAFYTMVLPFFALEYVFMQAFFSNRKMITPTLLGLGFSTLAMVISYVGVVKYGLRGVDAIATVAFAYTISRTLKTISLALLAKRFMEDLNIPAAFSFSFRMLVAGLFAGGSAFGVRKLYEGWVDVTSGETMSEIWQVVAPCLVLAGIIGLGVYLLALHLLCREEWNQTVSWTKAKLAARRNNNLV
ncbi:MAG: hypothetical protein JXA52_05815 [Planctomycetes bacterium]|nr:hypothetical protein [Planctomycetota bacterium]